MRSRRRHHRWPPARDQDVLEHPQAHREREDGRPAGDEMVLAQRERFETVFAQARTALENEGISIVDEKKLREEHRAFVQKYFDDVVRPGLVPVILDSVPEFPYLRNGVLYLAVRLTGNVAGQPPYNGALKHHGWVTTAVKFPSTSPALDPRVLAPAEVELS